MTINIGLLVLVLGLPIAFVLWKTAANENLCQDARAFSGIFAFLTAIGTVTVACTCFINKQTISTSEIVHFQHSPAISERYVTLPN